MDLREISLHDQRITYRAAGSGPVLLLIHGMAGSSETWRQVLPGLAQRFTVVAPDLLGHGGSEKPEGDYSLGAFACTLRDLLVALGHERVTVVGQSLGGGVAMQFCYQCPERTERLVLVGSGGLGREVSRLLRLLGLPGSEPVLRLACAARVRRAIESVSSGAVRVGLRPAPVVAELWRSYSSLTDDAGPDHGLGDVGAEIALALARCVERPAKLVVGVGLGEVAASTRIQDGVYVATVRVAREGDHLHATTLGADRLFYRRRSADHSAAGAHFRSRSAGGEVLA